jgi:hypothetical protein
MIVSEGVREKPAAHPPESAVKPSTWLRRAARSLRRRAILGSASRVCGTGCPGMRSIAAVGRARASSYGDRSVAVIEWAVGRWLTSKRRRRSLWVPIALRARRLMNFRHRCRCRPTHGRQRPALILLAQCRDHRIGAALPRLGVRGQRNRRSGARLHDRLDLGALGEQRLGIRPVEPVAHRRDDRRRRAQQD